MRTSSIAPTELRPATTPELSLVVPTKHEAANVELLVARLEDVLADVDAEVVFVDDSDDDTADVLVAAAAASSLPIQVVHREPPQRHGGLATAVVAGFERAHGEWVGVMDADLQHPPEIVPELLARARVGDVDLVVASRFADGGHADDFGPVRLALSRLSSGAARVGFRGALRGVTDPMSGFFLARRSEIRVDSLRPYGFKILLELLVRFPQLRKAEVPFAFGERHAGRSKASATEVARYGVHLVRLHWSSSIGRFVRFGIVGLSGLVVNTALLGIFTAHWHLYYLVAAVLATQGSTLWNFALAERFVFDATDSRGRLVRLGQFALVNNFLLLLRGPALYLLTSVFGVHYLVSNVLTLLALTLARFGAADTWIWGVRRLSERRLYHVHGLVSVASDVALPELERFSVASLDSPPAIDVTIGRVPSGRGKKLVELSRDRLVYDEGLGSTGFGVVVEFGDAISVTASRLLRRSPHVLYTNVVEPILRWHLAERGYALVHAACMSRGDRALLITARTDTGKTTTILKALDANPDLAFLSDDLTLLCPDGSVLTYPKPLTISRHTVAAVKRPLLSRRERLGLIFQSRLHSKSGRSFAFFLSKHNLPVATINSIVQLLVPPPKYHVDRLVPGVSMRERANYEQLVVIQRGDDFTRPLEPSEAVETVLANCADAYGFPPYEHLERFLHERSSIDLAGVEAETIRRVIAGRPATLLSSTSRNWFQSLPQALGLDGDTKTIGTDVGETLADQVVRVLPPSPVLSPEAGIE